MDVLFDDGGGIQNKNTIADFTNFLVTVQRSQSFGISMSDVHFFHMCVIWFLFLVLLFFSAFTIAISFFCSQLLVRAWSSLNRADGSVIVRYVKGETKLWTVENQTFFSNENTQTHTQTHVKWKLAVKNAMVFLKIFLLLSFFMRISTNER